MKEEIDFNKAYQRLQELLRNGKNTISVIEDEVDVELQMEYFDMSKKLYDGLDKKALIDQKDGLLNPALDIDEKKKLLSSLAKIDDPVAYRALEAYREKPDAGLEQWSKMAFQESKMVLETSLLGEAPIFVSTGMGGQGSNLRYFIVLVANEGLELAEWQKELVQKEIDYVFDENSGVVEEVKIEKDMFMITGLLDFAVNVKDTINKVVKECNQMGDFLMSSFIVTNVKKLSVEEIRNMVQEARDESKGSTEEYN
ncbi:hypothetical protein SAMN06265379_101845 [Saccharicrinis carchari]|uniref:Uncharacterized protein n=1 Tax=Saccharicrinis carchari TaxID=1168039 RepID=A0A521BBE5_SACCC|nr:hypothetical protein [Saccharicrinis carchari]SMO44379.1 hypothetical protein SAMN06265379_101845 [Saccharicrinis carchari]